MKAVLVAILGVRLCAGAQLTADSPWVVSASEPDSVALVIGRPARLLQPNEPSAKRISCSDAQPHCRYVGPFQQARVRSDLGQDWYKVLGSPPVLLPGPPNASSLAAGSVVLFLGSTEAAPWLLRHFPALSKCTEEWEEHCVRAFPYPGSTNGATALVATGAGARGAIYAAFEVSQKLLRVSPFWWWSGREPRYLGAVAVVAGLNITHGTPDYKCASPAPLLPRLPQAPSPPSVHLSCPS